MISLFISFYCIWLHQKGKAIHQQHSITMNMHRSWWGILLPEAQEPSGGVLCNFPKVPYWHLQIIHIIWHQNSSLWEETTQCLNSPHYRKLKNTPPSSHFLAPRHLQGQNSLKYPWENPAICWSFHLSFQVRTGWCLTSFPQPIKHHEVGWR